jgi:hypothetical protein
MRRKWHFFREAKNGENGAFQKKFERKKLAKNGTFETKNRLSPSKKPPGALWGCPELPHMYIGPFEMYKT